MPHFMIINQFLKTFLDNKMSIFEEYGAFNRKLQKLSPTSKNGRKSKIYPFTERVIYLSNWGIFLKKRIALVYGSIFEILEKM